MDNVPQVESPMPVLPKSKGLKKVFLALLVILLLIILVPLAFYFIKNGFWEQLNLNKSQSDIKSNNYVFSGEIDAIGNNQLTVSTIPFDQKIPTLTSDPSNLGNKKVSYTVQLTQDTSIDLPQLVNFSLTATPSARPKATLADLKVGQKVRIISKKNLDSLTTNQFEAQSVTVSAGIIVASGIIQEISANNLTLLAKPPSVPEEKNYTYIITDKTEIVDNAGKKPLPRSSLKNGVEGVIFSDKDIVSTNNPIAIRIELIFPVAAPPN